MRSGLRDPNLLTRCTTADRDNRCVRETLVTDKSLLNKTWAVSKASLDPLETRPFSPRPPLRRVRRRLWCPPRKPVQVLTIDPSSALFDPKTNPLRVRATSLLLSTVQPVLVLLDNVKKCPLVLCVNGLSRKSTLPTLSSRRFVNDPSCDKVIQFRFSLKACDKLTLVVLKATFRDPRTATV